MTNYEMFDFPGDVKARRIFSHSFLPDWLAGWLDGWLSGRTMNILDIALFFRYHFCYAVMNFWRRETINKEAQMARAFFGRECGWPGPLREQRAQIRHINS